MAELADHAFAHTCAVLGPCELAVEAAAAAVRRGGRSRWAVLGHARAESLQRADGAARPDLDQVAPDDLTELAAALAATRPAVERAIVDLDTRHDLDRVGFARAVGLRVGSAGARSAAVFLDWHHDLDPVVLARLGPGECDGLAAVIAGFDEANSEMDAAPTLGELLTRGPDVADHAAGCAACGDRLRAMVSVRTLLHHRPIEGLAPPEVRAAAAPSRLRRPSPPPPLEPEGPPLRWLRPVAIVAAAVVLVTAIGSIAAAWRDDPDAGQVDALVRIPAAGSALTVEPATLQGSSPQPVLLTNQATRDLEWVAAPDVSWLRVEPAIGTIEAGTTMELRVGVTAEAPEGPVSGAVRISGTDGSDTVIRLATTVERPPQVAASALGCDITATVEDEGEVRAVELHWMAGPGAERVVPMPAGDTTYTGRLPAGPPPVSWWVTASDARGNTSRTPEQSLVPPACPETP